MSDQTQGDAPAPIRPSTRIEIDGDTLVPDQDFCDEVLNGCTTRTARKLDAEGLPFVMLAGEKFRPLNEGRKWLAQRIVRQGAKRKR